MNECCFSSRGDVGSRQCFRKPAWIDVVGAVGIGGGGDVEIMRSTKRERTCTDSQLLPGLVEGN